jgi:hypothetical protein
MAVEGLGAAIQTQLMPFWILDFADARTVRVPRQFSAPSRILDWGS